MKICSICHKISASDQDHLDCVQKIRIEVENENFKRSILENLDLAKNSNLGIEVKAILERMTKEKKENE